MPTINSSTQNTRYKLHLDKQRINLGIDQQKLLIIEASDLVAALGAGADDEAVCQELAERLGEELLDGLLAQETRLVQLVEHFLQDFIFIAFLLFIYQIPIGIRVSI